LSLSLSLQRPQTFLLDNSERSAALFYLAEVLVKDPQRGAHKGAAHENGGASNGDESSQENGDGDANNDGGAEGGETDAFDSSRPQTSATSTTSSRPQTGSRSESEVPAVRVISSDGSEGEDPDASPDASPDAGSEAGVEDVGHEGDGNEEHLELHDEPAVERVSVAHVRASAPAGYTAQPTLKMCVDFVPDGVSSAKSVYFVKQMAAPVRVPPDPFAWPATRPAVTSADDRMLIPPPHPSNAALTHPLGHDTHARLCCLTFTLRDGRCLCQTRTRLRRLKCSSTSTLVRSTVAHC
jgi:hypothetical protein